MTGAPGSWPLVRARHLFREVNERGHDLPLASVTKHGGVELRADMPSAVWNPGDDTSGYKRVAPGDFVIGLRSFQSGLGSSDLCGLVSPAYTVLRPVSERVHQPYFKHLLKSHRIVSRLENISQGIRQGKTIACEDFLNLTLIVPPPHVQRAIADFLDAETARIDALIAKKRQLAQLAMSRLRARLESLLGDLDTDLVPLGRFVTSISQGTSPQASAHPAERDELGLLKLSAVKDGAFHATENKALPADFTGERLAPREGDLLVTRSNTPLLVGDVCTVDKDYPTLVLPDLIYRLRLSDDLMPRFATLCLRASRSRGILSSLARGTSQTMVKLRGEDIKSVPIPAASLDVQGRLVATAGQLRDRQEALANRLDRQIGLLRERRQALITSAVTGKLPIPGAAA